MSCIKNRRNTVVVLMMLGVILAAALTVPAGAHTSTVSHTWRKHYLPLAKKVFFTKTQADNRFLAKTGKAVDSLHADSADDADTLDGKDSTEFLDVAAKAADAELLDGIDSAAFARIAESTIVVDSSLTAAEGMHDVASVSIMVPGTQNQLVLVEASFQIWDSNNAACPTSGCTVDYRLADGDVNAAAGFVYVYPGVDSGGPAHAHDVFLASPGFHTYKLRAQSFGNGADEIQVGFLNLTAQTIPFTGTGAVP